MIANRCTGLVLISLVRFHVPLWVGGVMGIVAFVLLACLFLICFDRWVAGEDTTEDVEMADDKYRFECNCRARVFVAPQVADAPELSGSAGAS